MGLFVENRLSFVVLLVQLGFVVFGRVSKVRVGIRVSVRIRVSLVVVIGWVQDFPMWSE